MINSTNSNRLKNSISRLQIIVGNKDYTKEEIDILLKIIINDLEGALNDIQETQKNAWDLANKLSYIK